MSRQNRNYLELTLIITSIVSSHHNLDRQLLPSITRHRKTGVRPRNLFLTPLKPEA